MAIIVRDNFGGTAALTARSPDIGTQQWVLRQGPVLTCANGVVNSADFNTESIAEYPQAGATADGTVGWETSLINADSTSRFDLILRLQPDGSHYRLRAAGNAVLNLYRFSDLTTFASLVGSWSAPLLSAGWMRGLLSISNDANPVFNLSMWWSTSRADMGTGPALRVNNVGVPDNSGTAITAAGRVGFAVRYAQPAATFEFADSTVAPSGTLSGTAQLADVVPGGAIASGSSILTGTAQLADLVASGGMGPAAGTITIPDWRNLAGDALPGQAVPLLTFMRMLDGQQVLTLTNQVLANTTPANLVVANAALVPGTWYLAAAWNADGSVRGIAPFQAA